MQRRLLVRRVPLVIATICVLLVLVVVGFIVFFYAAESIDDRGSPALAAEWQARLDQYDTPAAAQAVDPDIIIHRFPNGEWIFGLAKDSHGLWNRGGGTLVVKDSNGQIQAFFGHVCGPGHLCIWGQSEQGVADYYKALVEAGFTKHPLK